MGDENRGKIIWLASYPKSGNTWVRIFLTNLIRNDNKPADINDLEHLHIASSRQLFDRISGVFSADLNDDAIDLLRPDVYIHLADESERKSQYPVFIKVHDAYQYLPTGWPMFPESATAGVIYIVRNPLDVAVSYSHHNGISIDRTIALMNDQSSFVGGPPEGLGKQLREKLTSWSAHVSGWITCQTKKLLVIRYEDLQADSMTEFKKIALFCGIIDSFKEVEKAVLFSRFDILQSQESKYGFKENPKNATGGFFRKGKIGEWKNYLTKIQKEAIYSNNYNMMKMFNYTIE